MRRVGRNFGARSTFESVLMRSRGLCVVGLAALLALFVSAPALAAGERATVSLHLAFRAVAHGVSDLQVSGPYVSFTQTASNRQRTVARLVLLDDRTGKRIATPRGCTLAFLGDPRVGLYCYSRSSGLMYDAFNVRTRKLRRLPCSGSCQRPPANLVAVGSRWFEVEIDPHQPCGDGIHNSCGPTTFAFYNIRTGRQKVPVTSGSETVELNSPTLTRRLCPPLVEPPGYSPTTDTGSTPTTITGSSFTFDGPFAVAQKPSGIYIQRCGSRLDLPLVTPPYAGSVLENASGVAFCDLDTASTRGFLLPSLKPYTISPPVFNVGGRPVCPRFGPRHAYAVGTTVRQTLWTARLPRALSVSTRHK
jgi:hypothetical protein